MEPKGGQQIENYIKVNFRHLYSPLHPHIQNILVYYVIQIDTRSHLHVPVRAIINLGETDPTKQIDMTIYYLSVL